MEQQKIIKRLELIKNLISLEEENEIAYQVIRIQALELRDEVKIILALLNKKEYGKAIIEIEAFINNEQQIALYIDTEIEALRFEAKAIEAQIQQKSEEKAELEKLIHEFSIRHSKELGELTLKILNYRKEKNKDTPQEEETKKDYEDFYSSYEASKDEEIALLNEDELKEIKDKYRKASKLCHPDVVLEEQKEEAHNVFTELKTAYEQNDLKRVCEILESLQQVRVFSSKADTENEKGSLQVELHRLRLLLKTITEEIAIIKKSETMEQITNIKDWDEYFTISKQKLQEQITQLEDERK